MVNVDLASWAILLIVALCAFLEDSVGLGIVLPAETVVIAAAAAAAAGAVNVWAVLAVAWVAAVAGDCVGFWIGWHFGQRLIDKFGRPLHLTPERVAKANDVVSRWGVLGVAAGRFIPAVRILIMPTAGIVRMPPVLFLIGDMVGVAGWAALHVSIGYLVGFGLEKHSGPGALVAIGVIAVAIIAALFVYHRRRKANAAAPHAPQAARE
jgi:membrane protein DedA with SNARE-associated domain